MMLEREKHPRVFTRLAGEADAEFLRSVYASTREEELASLPWPAEAKQRFIDQQFYAQTQAYRSNYPGAEFLIFQVEGIDAGRLYLHQRPDEIRIMDIAVLPGFRNRGVGGTVLNGVLAMGARTNRRVTIHVEVFNPAMRLYQRLGFIEVSRTQVHVLMEWCPAPPPVPSSVE